MKLDRRRIRRFKARLLGHYANAQETDAVHRGRSWYADAFALASKIGERTGIGHTKAAAILAVLSPQVPWDYQQRRTEAWIVGEQETRGSQTYAGYGTNVEKARRILRGEAPATVVGGPKVSAFYRNLCGDLSVFTIDRWAIHAATGWKTTDRPPVGQRREEIVQACREAAEDVGETPAVFQAIVWEQVRA